MEFIKYRDFISREDKDNRSLPRVGTLFIDGEFDSSDCNFYPNHEIFGKSQGGSFPLYAKMNWERDPHTGKTRWTHFDSAFAHVPGISHDGKREYSYPFHIYDYQVKEYIGEGKKHRGVTFRIELDEPFFINERGSLDGYELAVEMERKQQNQ